MRNTLLHQFRGTLGGLILGDRFGASAAHAPINLHQWAIGQVQHPLGQSHPQPDLAESGLAESGLAATRPDLPSPNPARLSHWGQQAIEVAASVSEGRCPQLAARPDAIAGLALATVPIALLHHDSLDRLQAALHQAIPAAQSDPDLLSGGLAIGCLFHQIWHNRVWHNRGSVDFAPAPAALLADLIADLETAAAAPMVAALQRVPGWLSENAGLGNIRQQLASLPANPAMPIALAIYALLSTPHAVALVLQRSCQLGVKPQLTCALAGALAGALNGTTGLPASCLLGLGGGAALAQVSQDISSQNTSSQNTSSQNISSQPSLPDWVMLSDRLLGQWAGAHNLQHWLTQPDWQAIVAPPRSAWASTSRLRGKL